MQKPTEKEAPNVVGLINVDGQAIQITEDANGGIKTTAISPTQEENILFEKTLLEDGFQHFLENDLNKVANEVYQTLRQDLRLNIEKIVLSSLGFTNSFGRWEVDRSNNRTSAVNEVISAKVKQYICDETEKILEADAKKMITKEIGASIRKEFRSCLAAEINRNIRSAAQEAAKVMVAAMVGSEMELFKEKGAKIAREALLGKRDKVLYEKAVQMTYNDRNPNPYHPRVQLDKKE